jgi:hypothetical protein
MTSPIVLIVSPSPDADGRKAYGSRGQLFDGHFDGRLVVRRSTQPLLDAGRTLVAEGVDPATPIVMRHSGWDDDALRATVGAAANLTVKDNRGKPVFADWQPSAGHQTHPEMSPRHQIEEAGAPQAGGKNSYRPERQAASWAQDHVFQRDGGAQLPRKQEGR